MLALTHHLLAHRLAGRHRPSVCPSLPPPRWLGAAPDPSVPPQLQGTVQPAAAFNDDGDAQVLRKAMKGLGKWGPRTSPSAGPMGRCSPTDRGGGENPRRAAEKPWGDKELWELPFPHAPVCRGGGGVPGSCLGAAALAAVLAGTDEGAIIDVVTKRSNAQRQQIIKAYKAHYGRVLLAPLPPHCPRPSLSDILPSLKEIPLGTRWAALLCPAMTPPWQNEVFRAASHFGCTSSPREHPFPFYFPILEASRLRMSPEPPPRM